MGIYNRFVRLKTNSIKLVTNPAPAAAKANCGIDRSGEFVRELDGWV